jgi:hypothetical protein
MTKLNVKLRYFDFRIWTFDIPHPRSISRYVTCLSRVVFGAGGMRVYNEKSTVKSRFTTEVAEQKSGRAFGAVSRPETAVVSDEAGGKKYEGCIPDSSSSLELGTGNLRLETVAFR